MAWASMRQTTRVEDMAYCLMGIFEIHMPMIYGEGSKAFTRLQEEITKQSCDLSLFAWTARAPRRAADEVDEDLFLLGEHEQYSGLFARAPSEFRDCWDIEHRKRGGLLSKEFTVTNKGLRIETALVKSDRFSRDPILNLGVHKKSLAQDSDTYGNWVGIYLAKTPVGYVRRSFDALYVSGSDGRYAFPSQTIYIRKEINTSEQVSLIHRFQGSIILLTGVEYLAPDRIMPQELWDPVRSLFLKQDIGIMALLSFRKANVGFSTRGEPVCRVWVPEQAVYWELLEFMKTRTEVFDYVGTDALSTFLGMDQYRGPIPFAQAITKNPHEDIIHGNRMEISASILPGTYENEGLVFELSVTARFFSEESTGSPDRREPESALHEARLTQLSVPEETKGGSGRLFCSIKANTY